MYKAVIFDLDHTLYDFTKPHKTAIAAINAYMADHFGLTGEEADQKGKEAHELTRQKVGYDSPASHSRTLRYQTLCEMLGENEFLHARVMGELYWNTFYAAMEKDASVEKVLAALHEKGFRIVIGTDMTAAEQYRKIEVLGLSQYIDYLVTSEEAGEDKPSRQILDLCVKKAGCRKEECIFVGDHPMKDVLGPIRYGMDAVWCRHFNPEKFLNMFDIKVDLSEPITHRIEHYEDVITADGIDLGGIIL